jgi:MarR family transcriptional regulator, organic hydroperoxide resistance regulator
MRPNVVCRMRSLAAAPRRTLTSVPASPPEQSLGDVLDFMRLLWAVDHALQQRSKQMLLEVGVTGPQRLVLRVVGRYPGIAAGELASVLHVHPSTLTGVLKRLERQKLIERTRDPSDGRRALLVLSPRGKKLDASNRGTIETMVRKALEHLPPGQVVAAAHVLRGLAEHLEPEPARNGKHR